MDEITHTIMPGNNGGWGGTALGNRRETIRPRP